MCVCVSFYTLSFMSRGERQREGSQTQEVCACGSGFKTTNILNEGHRSHVDDEDDNG
jgi:hypothetical protein